MNTLFGLGRQNIGNKLINFAGASPDTFKATLLTMSTQAGKIFLVTSASNASPIVLGVSSTTGIAPGDIVVVGGVGGNLAANGTWQVGTVVANTSISLLTRLDGNNSTGSAAYTSGGWIIDLSSGAVLTDVSANSSGTDATLSGVTNTLGVINAGSSTWTNPPATKVWGVAIYDNTASNDLIAWYDGNYQVYVITTAAPGATSLAVARLGATIPSGAVLNFSDGTTATTNAQAAVGATSLSVNSTAATIHAQATADVATLSSGLPVTPTGNNNFTFVPDTGANKLFVI
jgi:hypothetical protein